MHYLRFVPTLSGSIDITAEVNAEAVLAETSFQLVYITGDPIVVPVGPIEVVFVPVVTCDVEVSGQISGGIQVGCSMKLQSGFEWRADTGATPVNSANAWDSGTPSVNAYAQLGLIFKPMVPEVDLKIYGLVGPYLKAEVPRLEMNVSTQTSPSQEEFTVDAILRGSAGGHFKVLRRFGVDFELAAVEEVFHLVDIVTPNSGELQAGIQ